MAIRQSAFRLSLKLCPSAIRQLLNSHCYFDCDWILPSADGHSGYLHSPQISVNHRNRQPVDPATVNCMASGYSVYHRHRSSTNLNFIKQKFPSFARPPPTTSSKIRKPSRNRSFINNDHHLNSTTPFIKRKASLKYVFSVQNDK